MKLVVSDGNELTVRPVGAVLVRVRRLAGGPPIRRHGYAILEDAAARAAVRELIDIGLYNHEFFRAES